MASSKGSAAGSGPQAGGNMRGNGRGNNGDIVRILRQLTEATETMALANTGLQGPSGLAGGAGGGLDLAQVADNSIARLLGGKPDGDVNRLQQRLAQVFPARPGEEGDDDYDYRPTGAQPVDNAGGALIAGAQAVFYQQARVLGTSIHGLLDNLRPVVIAADDDDIASLVAMVGAKVDEIVEEFGRDGGAVQPKLQAAARTLDDLIGRLKAKLGLAGQNPAGRLEMDLMQLDLISENMLMLDSLVDQLTVTLLRQYTDRVLNGVGASYVRLEWTVRAIPTAVDQVAAEFDALRVVAADRMLLFVDQDMTNPSVEQILQWAREAGGGSWPRMLAEGRTDDIDAVRTEATSLLEQLDLLASHGGLRNLGFGLVGTTRLHNALRELDTLIRRVVLLTGMILLPPKPAPAGQPQPVQQQPAPPQPGQPQRGQVQRAQPQARQAQAGQTQPAQTQPAQTQPGQTQPGQTQPGGP